MNRHELYDAVWRVPLAKVARQLQINDDRLRQICRDAEIPVPGRGHWQQIYNGDTPPQPKLGGNKEELVTFPRPLRAKAASNQADAESPAVSEPLTVKRPGPEDGGTAAAAPTAGERAGASGADEGAGAPAADAGIDLPADVSVLFWESLGDRWHRQQQALAFIARLDAVASTLPDEEARTVRANLRKVLQGLYAQDPVRAAIQALRTTR